MKNETMFVSVTATLNSGVGTQEDYQKYFKDSFLYKEHMDNSEVASAFDFIMNGGINNWEHLYSIMEYLDDMLLS